jgi:16S rRNA (uracil1498-N3)-methyltransferase
MEIANYQNAFDNRFIMDLYRFHVADLLPQLGAGGPVTLPDSEGHHARRVLRLTGGETVEVFDGKGAAAKGRLIGEHGQPVREPVKIHIKDQPTVTPPPRPALTLATAIPKGDRAEWLIEQASQLNVTRIAWLDCDRSVVKTKEGGNKLEKWQRLAMESAKQCGRAHLLDIAEPVPLATLLQRAASDAPKILWLEPREGGHSRSVREAVKKSDEQITALIGPEGGWSPREFALLEQGAERGILSRVRLTPTVLRIETACAAVAAIIMAD